MNNRKEIQKASIMAARATASCIRTCLGPKAMLKMLMDPMGGIVMTNDGNAILREITVNHPAAKSFIEMARAQDEETGDGTTSTIVIAGELMAKAEQFLDQNIHPNVINRAYADALTLVIEQSNNVYSKVIDIDNDSEVNTIVKSCLATKMMGKYSDFAVDIAVKAIRAIAVTTGDKKDIDIKRYCRIEKVPGGNIEDSAVVKGCVVNKDVVHPKMKRRIEKPRVILLDCNLEYKKGESQTNIELMNEADFTKVLQHEEVEVKRMCDEIIALKPDLVITEKGISDLAQHYLVKAGISALRRFKKTDNNRLARCTGAVIAHDTKDLGEENVGTMCDLFEIKKIGDEYFAYIISERATVSTILLRGPSKDIINEVERNLHDAIYVVRNILLLPKIVPGGGAYEMGLGSVLRSTHASTKGLTHAIFVAIADALEVIPKVLIQNSGKHVGGSVLKQTTELRFKHSQESTEKGSTKKANWTWGVDGVTGKLIDMNDHQIWDPLTVRLQALKTAFENCIMLLRIDDIVSGTKKKDGEEGGNPRGVAA
uniref:T-complex protein 1 subunit gamma n=1 Tax=Rhabditophanes sp. KR3021 TaxID=114890 RepID=A0AC35TQ11_9BILA